MCSQCVPNVFLCVGLYIGVDWGVGRVQGAQISEEGVLKKKKVPYIVSDLTWIICEGTDFWENIFLKKNFEPEKKFQAEETLRFEIGDKVRANVGKGSWAETLNPKP